MAQNSCYWCDDAIYGDNGYFYTYDGEKYGYFCSRKCVNEVPAGKGYIVSCCFLTTAVCDWRGESDDCDTLQSLREFRDRYMLSMPERARLVEEYYVIAPRIIAGIESLPELESRAIYAELCDRYIDPAAAAAACGQDEEALDIYTAMIFWLERQLLVLYRNNVRVRPPLA